MRAALIHHPTRPSALVAAFLLLGCAACNKDGSNKPFGWVRSGNRLYYDFYGVQDTVPDFRYLEINREDKHYNILECMPGSTALSPPLFGQLYDIDVKVESKGLYELVVSTCGLGPTVGQTDYLYAPKKPFLYQEIPAYTCASSTNSSNYIVNADTTLTVPMGTFKVYIMQHRGGDKSYWNVQEGLIMYEVRNRYRTTWRGTLRLNRIER